MRRRQFLRVGAAVLALPARAWAQPTRRYRVGWASFASGEPSPFLDAFREGLKDHGWVEGRNVVIEPHWGLGSEEHGPARLRQLEASGLDVIVTQGPVALSVLRAGIRLPVVFGFSGDPVEAGLVESLSRPGRNFTGVSLLSFDLVGKRIELLRELAPRAHRLAILARPQHQGEQTEREVSARVAKTVGMEITYHPVLAVADIEPAFEAMHRARSDAVVVFPDAQLLQQGSRIADLASRERLAGISGWAGFAEVGLLMTYGPVLRDSFRRLGFYVDRILRGNRPADLPVELPSVVELVLNSRTAKTLGLPIPPSMLVRANRVIE